MAPHNPHQEPQADQEFQADQELQADQGHQADQEPQALQDPRADQEPQAGQGHQGPQDMAHLDLLMAAHLGDNTAGTENGQTAKVLNICLAIRMIYFIVQ